MAVFKVTEDFDIDIAALNAAEFNINSDLTKVKHITTMKTADRFYDQHEQIKVLLDLYARLLRKEVTDLSDMATEARLLDSAIGKRIDHMGGR